MSWQIVRGSSGKVCFELDVERALIRVRHSRECTDTIDLAEFGLRHWQEGGTIPPDLGRILGHDPFGYNPVPYSGGPSSTNKGIDFSADS